MNRLQRFKQAGAIIAEDLGSISYLRKKYTISGAPTVINSPFWNSLSFLSTTPDYITMTATGGITALNANGSYITVSIWVYATNGVNTKVLVSKDGSTDGWFLYMNDAEQFLLGTKAAGVTAVTTTNTDVVSLNTWNHVAAVFKIDTGVLGNNLGTVYVNGSSVNSSTVQTILPQVSTNDLKIGARGVGVTGMYGALANLIIFPRALSSGEISNIFYNKVF